MFNEAEAWQPYIDSSSDTSGSSGRAGGYLLAFPPGLSDKSLEHSSYLWKTPSVGGKSIVKANSGGRTVAGMLLVSC